jgi:hypothetical protein
MNERLFGKTTKPETLEQADSVVTQARRIVGSAKCRFRVLALEGAARETSSAPAACLRERPYYVIADLDLRDVRTC